MDKAVKKKLGAFYSPTILAHYVASKLNNLIHCEKDSITILDPAVGDGELLVEMFNIRQDTSDTYIGVDVDEVALNNTRIRLAEIGIDSFLFNTDALSPKSNQYIDGWDYIKYRSYIDEIDCIISNPPWGAEISIDPKELSTFKTATGQYDIYDLFIENSLDILRIGGVYAFIVPDSIFRKEHSPIRKILLETTSIKLIARMGEFFFEGVNTPVSVIIGVNGYSANNLIQCVHLSNDIAKKILANNLSIHSIEANYSHICEQDYFINNNYNFIIDIASDDVKLMKHLEAFPKLKSCLKSTRGVELSKKGNVIQCPHCNLWQPYPSTKNLTAQCMHCKESFDIERSKKSFIIGTKEQLESPLPFLRGEDLSRYSYSQKVYIEVKKPGINYKTLSLYQIPKILVRKTGVGITAVLDYDGNVVNQVVYMLHMRDNNTLPLEFFIAVLNSRIITYFIIKNYGSTKWCTHPYLSQEMIEKLPIPDFSNFSDEDWTLVSRIESIVKEIYNSSLRNPTLEMDIELESNLLKLFHLDSTDFVHIMEEISKVEQLAPFRRLLNIPRSKWDLDI